MTLTHTIKTFRSEKCKPDHKEDATKNNNMGGIQVVKSRGLQGQEDAEAIETCLNVNVKNHYNIKSNLVIPPTINIW